jgi:hypothetical protein
MDIKAGELKPATRNIWARGLCMLLFVIVFCIFQTFLTLTAVVQFLWVLFTQEPNHILGRFGSSMSIWFGDVTRFLTCVSEDKPFPWGPWPTPDYVEPTSPARQSLSPTP